MPRRQRTRARPVFFLLVRPPPTSTLFPYTTLFRSRRPDGVAVVVSAAPALAGAPAKERSEEHTSELQSLAQLVCRLLLEKKNSRHEAASHQPGSPIVLNSTTDMNATESATLRKKSG